MAHVEKYTARSAATIIGHNNRCWATSSNEDIDDSRSELNYSLTPERDVSDYDYYKERMSELYCYHRKDVVTCAAWVITLPEGIEDEERQREFFQHTYEFIADRYGEENIVQATVHRDEGRDGVSFDRWTSRLAADDEGHIDIQRIGRDHMHVLFIPAAEDRNPKHEQEEKVCANDVLTREDLRTWHDDLQAYLDEHGMDDCRVKNGATIGSGMTVEQLKHITDLEQDNIRLRDENTVLRDKVVEFEKEYSHTTEGGRW